MDTIKGGLASVCANYVRIGSRSFGDLALRMILESLYGSLASSGQLSVSLSGGGTFEGIHNIEEGRGQLSFIDSSTSVGVEEIQGVSYSQLKASESHDKKCD